MDETQSLNTVWEETFRLLNTVSNDEHYAPRWAFVPPHADVKLCAQAPFTLCLAIDGAGVGVSHSVLKELEPLTSKLKESLLKITGSPTLNAKEVVRQYEKICRDLKELWIFLYEKILYPALRAHFPCMKEKSQ